MSEQPAIRRSSSPSEANVRDGMSSPSSHGMSEAISGPGSVAGAAEMRRRPRAAPPRRRGGRDEARDVKVRELLACAESDDAAYRIVRRDADGDAIARHDL